MTYRPLHLILLILLAFSLGLLLALAEGLPAPENVTDNTHLWYSDEITRQYKAGIVSAPEPIAGPPKGEIKALEIASNDALEMTMMLNMSPKDRKAPLHANYLRNVMPDGTEYCFDFCLRHGEFRRKDCDK